MQTNPRRRTIDFDRFVRLDNGAQPTSTSSGTRRDAASSTACLVTTRGREVDVVRSPARGSIDFFVQHPTGWRRDEPRRSNTHTRKTCTRMCTFSRMQFWRQHSSSNFPHSDRAWALGRLSRHISCASLVSAQLTGPASSCSFNSSFGLSGRWSGNLCRHICSVWRRVGVTHGLLAHQPGMCPAWEIWGSAHLQPRPSCQTVRPMSSSTNQPWAELYMHTRTPHAYIFENTHMFPNLQHT